MIHLQDNNFKWPNKIREILHKVGRPDLWDNQCLITYENIHKMVKKNHLLISLNKTGVSNYDQIIKAKYTSLSQNKP